jgi:hypothetical protein
LPKVFELGSFALGFFFGGGVSSRGGRQVVDEAANHPRARTQLDSSAVIQKTNDGVAEDLVQQRLADSPLSVGQKLFHVLLHLKHDLVPSLLVLFQTLVSPGSALAAALRLASAFPAAAPDASPVALLLSFFLSPSELLHLLGSQYQKAARHKLCRSRQIFRLFGSPEVQTVRSFGFFFVHFHQGRVRIDHCKSAVGLGQPEKVGAGNVARLNGLWQSAQFQD